MSGPSGPYRNALADQGASVEDWWNAPKSTFSILPIAERQDTGALVPWLPGVVTDAWSTLNRVARAGRPDSETLRDDSGAATGGRGFYEQKVPVELPGLGTRYAPQGLLDGLTLAGTPALGSIGVRAMPRPTPGNFGKSFKGRDGRWYALDKDGSFVTVRDVNDQQVGTYELQDSGKSTQVVRADISKPHQRNRISSEVYNRLGAEADAAGGKLVPSYYDDTWDQTLDGRSFWESRGFDFSRKPSDYDLFANPETASPVPLALQLANSDLPMDLASRMARAKEMGFDTDNVLYHGTETPGFMEFDQTKGMPGVWLADNPWVANIYTGEDGGGVLPLYARSNKIAEIDAEGNGPFGIGWSYFKDRQNARFEEWKEKAKSKLGFLSKSDRELKSWIDSLTSEKDLRRAYELHGYDDAGPIRHLMSANEGSKYKRILDYMNDVVDPADTQISDVFSDLSANGFEGVRLNNLVDVGDPRGLSKTHQSQTVIFDPRNIRSVNAAFDPAMSDSSNLLAANREVASSVPLALQTDNQDSLDVNEWLRRNGYL